MLTFDITLTAGFAVATYPAGATFGPRHLHDWEFVWMIEGDAVYERGGETFPAPQGSVLLCRPGATDGFVWDTRRRTRHGWFHFHLLGDTPPEWNAPDTWATVRRPAPPSGSGSDTGELLPTLFRQLIAARNDTGVAPRVLALALLAAFVAPNNTGLGGVERAQYPDAVTFALAFIAARIEEKPGDPLPLAEIARIAFVSPEHLCRLFTRYTKHTPAETVRLMRLDRAAVLLARTNFSVGEIATLCGFASPFHFSRRFKEAFGQTPSDLRRGLAEDGESVPITRLVQLS